MAELMAKIFNFISKEALIMSMAFLPFLELKAAIPAGISMGLHPFHAFLLALIGSTLPAPLILLSFRPFFNYLKQSRTFRKLAERQSDRILRKGRNIKKYYALGLFLFVAIPAPTTGVWTGSMAAALLNIRLKYALPAIFLGNTVAGLIVLAVSYGLLG